MKILNSFHLKIIALTAMLIDHLGAIFFPDFYILRIIGRVAFILYAFMLVEGFILTKNLKKYISKVGVWAILSEIPYDLAFHKKLFYWEDQNIFFTLFLGLSGMYFISRSEKLLNKILIAGIFLSASIIFKVDYLWYGVSIIFLFYFFRNNTQLKLVLIEGINLAASFKILALQFFGFLGFIPILMYNGKRGPKIGDIYYSFYAVHLLLFALIKIYL